jgi:hypothetical protein
VKSDPGGGVLTLHPQVGGEVAGRMQAADAIMWLLGDTHS